jgi:hypothetical protein
MASYRFGDLAAPLVPREQAATSAAPRRGDEAATERQLIVFVSSP